MPCETKNLPARTRSIYSTAMEINRQKSQFQLAKPAEALTPTLVEKVQRPLLLLPAPDHYRIMQEVETIISEIPEAEIKKSIPVANDEKTIAYNNMRNLGISLSAILFMLMMGAKFFDSCINAVSSKFNDLILQGSLFIISMIQGACLIKGDMLNTPYYHLSLKGDLVPIYSLALLIVFALFYTSFQNFVWVKRGVIFVTLLPLAVMTNIFRIAVAFSLAVHHGSAFADQMFHGVLMDMVFISLVLELIFFEFVVSTDWA